MRTPVSWFIMVNNLVQNVIDRKSEHGCGSEKKKKERDEKKREREYIDCLVWYD